MIDNNTSVCPNLEILRLDSCEGFSSICVSGLARLYEVELSLSEQLDVKIVAPMLRVFKIHSWNWNSKIDVLACESTLRNLTLSCVPNMTTDGLTSLVSKFLGLEELVLNHLYVECIEIPNQTKLLQLEVDHCFRLKRNVRIDAPNLLLLKYCGNILPFEDLFLKLKGFTNMKVIVATQYKKEVLVCEVLDENVLKMIYDYQAMELTVEVEHMYITTHELLVDRLFRSGDHWKAISIVSRDQQSIRKFLEVINKEKLKEKEEDVNCCRYKFFKCWRHSLFDAEMIDEETTMTPDLFKCFVAMGYDIAHIKLEWT